MALADIIAVLGVLFGFGWLILSKISEKKPGFKRWLQDLNPPKDPINMLRNRDKLEVQSVPLNGGTSLI